jgi:hypothetical protein
MPRLDAESWIWLEPLTRECQIQNPGLAKLHIRPNGQCTGTRLLQLFQPVEKHLYLQKNMGLCLTTRECRDELFTVRCDVVVPNPIDASGWVRNPKSPSQTWRTFLDNHVSQLASVDFFTVHAVWFEFLFVFIVVAHDRGASFTLM